MAIVLMATILETAVIVDHQHGPFTALPGKAVASVIKCLIGPEDAAAIAAGIQMPGHLAASVHEMVMVADVEATSASCPGSRSARIAGTDNEAENVQEERTAGNVTEAIAVTGTITVVMTLGGVREIVVAREDMTKEEATLNAKTTNRWRRVWVLAKLRFLVCLR